LSIVAAAPIEEAEVPQRGLRVYALADPAIVAEAAPAIAKALFGMDSTQDGGRIFDVHPTSGRLYYADHDALWKNTEGSDLPGDRRTAETLARAFLEEAQRKLAGDRRLRELGVGALFPSDLRPSAIGLVVAKSGNAPDHWLCHFSAFLPVNESRSARVDGAAVDIRIGRHGRVVGFSTRWRPVTGDLLSAPLGAPQEADSVRPFGAVSPPAAPTSGIIAAPAAPVAPSVVSTAEAEDHHGHDEPHAEPAAQPAEQVYALADDNAAQTFLAPMLVTLEGHHGSVDPASAHSMVIDVMQRETDTGLTLGASVAGGSGDFQVQWAAWSPVSGSDTEPRVFDGTGSIDLPAGVWTVTVFVRDKLTGAVAQAERQTLSHGKEGGE
jgi:hypothetical protein